MLGERRVLVLSERACRLEHTEVFV